MNPLILVSSSAALAMACFLWGVQDAVKGNDWAVIMWSLLFGANCFSFLLSMFTIIQLEITKHESTDQN